MSISTRDFGLTQARDNDKSNDISLVSSTQATSSFYYLSCDIIFYIISFFEGTNNCNSTATIRRLWNTMENSNSKSNLLSTNKQFHTYKCLTFMYKLNQKSSIEYYKNENDIRKKIIMNNPIKQLSLNLVYCNDITNLNALNDVNMYKLGISYLNTLLPSLLLMLLLQI